MNPLESMRRKMRATGLYALDGTTAVDRELLAYAAGFELACAEILKLQAEFFAATASDYGLALREARFGLASGEGTPEARRGKILALGAVTPADFTRGGVERALRAAGLDAEICERPGTGNLSLNCPASADETERKNALRTANLFLPAHLGAELDFRSISWNNIDQRNETFDEKDALSLTWDAIDHYENGMLER